MCGIPWIIDSIEHLIRKNQFELSKIFSFDAGGTVYSRAEGLMSANGMIGFALNALKQAMHSVQSDRLLLVPYDALVHDPAAVMRVVYDFTGLLPFEHDFEKVAFDAAEFDARLGTPGLHDIRRRCSMWRVRQSSRRISGNATKARAFGETRNLPRAATE